MPTSAFAPRIISISDNSWVCGTSASRFLLTRMPLLIAWTGTSEGLTHIRSNWGSLGETTRWDVDCVPPPRQFSSNSMACQRLSLQGFGTLDPWTESLTVRLLFTKGSFEHVFCSCSFVLDEHQFPPSNQFAAAATGHSIREGFPGYI